MVGGGRANRQPSVEDWLKLFKMCEVNRKPGTKLSTKLSREGKGHSKGEGSKKAGEDRANDEGGGSPLELLRRRMRETGC